MDRKDFLIKSGGLCLAALGFGSLLQSCKSAYYAPFAHTGNQITLKKAELSERSFVLIKTEKFNEPIYLSKIAEDNYSALLMYCTHKGCELNPAGNLLVCPCHGSEFTNTGKVLEGPAEKDLHKFNVISDNENIYIQL